jgi:peptide/nickel transport system substrate-binding protein
MLSSDPSKADSVRGAASQLTRRRFLSLVAATSSAALLAACQSAPAPAAKPTEAPKPAAVATQVPPTAVPAAAPAAGASPAASPSPAAAAGAAPAPAPAAAVASKPGGKKVYKLALLGDVSTMDPAIMNSQIDFQIAEAIYNFMGRYTYDPPLGNAIIPELSEKWEVSEDAKTWTFYLRKGVKFHKGYGDLTAEDVKFNWERIKDPKTASPFKAEFDGSTITVLDPYTIRIVFDRQNPAFVSSSLGFRPGFVVSPKAFQELGDRWKTGPIGSGPFIWDTYQAGSSLLLKQNPEYWGPKPKVDEILYRFKVDDKAAMLAVAKGELDAYYLSDPDLMAQAATNPDPNTVFLKSNAGQAPFTLWFNTQRKPLDDVRVRHALRYAVDNEAIGRDLFGGLAQPINSYLPPFMFGYSEDVMKFEYNPDKARQLLKDANVPADWSPSVMGHSTLLISRRVIEAVASYWTEVGVKARPELVEQAVINQRTTPKDFDIWGTYITRIDPSQLTAPYWHSASPTNYSSFKSGDDLINVTRTEPDPDKRLKAYRDLQAKISEESPAAFIVACSEGILVNKRVGGLKGAGWQERHPWWDVDVPAE